MLKPVKILTKNYELPDSHTLAVYEKQGGYRAARTALGMSQQQIIDEVKKSNIRGRGGAGFPTGVKWSFVRPHPTKPAYLVVNGDEGEPGTFKDRTIMERDPHRLLEGCIIACRGIGAHTAYIYVRGELRLAQARVEAAIRDARAKGYLGKNPFGRDYAVEVYVHCNAGAYICGEETALLNSLEGRRGEPRFRPPFPAQAGAFGCPTTVNNVETIATCPTIIEMGGNAFSRLSELHHLGDGGCRLFGVSGHVNRPGIYEACVGLTLRELVDGLGGGVQDGAGLLAVIPGGSSCPVLRPDEIVDAPDEHAFLHPWHGKSVLDVPIGVDTMREMGTMAGTACATVLSSKANPVLALQNIVRFYSRESCGQCTPCREGTAWLERIVDKIVDRTATMQELDMVHEIASNVMGNTICAFGDGASMPVLAFARKFRKEIEGHLGSGGARSAERLVS